MSESIRQILELTGIWLYAIGRIAGVVAIVWIIATRLDNDTSKFFLIVLTLIVGLTFDIRYRHDDGNRIENPTGQSTAAQDEKRSE